MIRSLRAKLLLGTFLVIVLVMTAVIVVVEHRQRAAIIGEVQRRGEVLARNLAAISYTPLLLYNFTALGQKFVRVPPDLAAVTAVVLAAVARWGRPGRYPDRVGWRPAVAVRTG